MDKSTKTATAKAVKVATHGRPRKVSNWWYVVGFLTGIAGVFVFWWFIWPLVISLFY